MEIPSWFGAEEFYALLNTFQIIAVIYLVSVIVKSIGHFKDLNIKLKASKLKSWWAERKKRREEKIWGG